MLKTMVFFIDCLIFLPVLVVAPVLKMVRKVGIQRFPLTRKVLLKVGVFPINDHYYEPQFNYLSTNTLNQRSLTGIDWNIDQQLTLLKGFKYANETDFGFEPSRTSYDFYFGNGAFESGDAEYWYQIIRYIKPKKILEIGSGYSTLLATKAIKQNAKESQAYHCEHTCIEPFEMPWLESLNVNVIRQKVENMELSFFAKLEEGDILFIDSSHILRPNGDVLFEYLELLPSLNQGVIVHIHDIFSPKNYPHEWLREKCLFWNEQYVLEAFLTNNSQWKVIGALNMLHVKHYDKLKLVAPSVTKGHQPGSFYIQKL